MTFPYVGANGLFTRIGALGGLLNSVNTFLNSGNLSAAGIEAIGAAVDHVAGEYAPPDLNLTTGLYTQRDAYRQVHLTFLAALQQIARNTLVQMVNEYSPQPNTTLPTALNYLVYRMGQDAQTIPEQTVSVADVAGSTNVGNGVLATSALNPNASNIDYSSYSETINIACTVDAQSGGATPGAEIFTVLGAANQPNSLAWNWPQGSGAALTIQAVDALQNNVGGQVLQNGAGQTWTNPAVGPDNWTIVSGTVGTNITQAAAPNVYKGTSGFAFPFPAAATQHLLQMFGATPSTAGNGGGSPYVISPLTQYFVSFWIKASAVPTAGQFAVFLSDGLGNIIKDTAGTNNAFSLPLTSVTTGWVNYTFAVRTPANLGSNGIGLALEFESAANTGVTVYLGHIAMSPAVPFYQGGPSFRVFSGNPNFIQGDSFNTTVTPTGTNYQWPRMVDILWGARALGIQLPSSTTPTIPNSLIV